jgi:hypothetical protein
MMGLIAEGLGPSDQAVVSKFGTEIVRILRKASEAVSKGEASERSRIWFDDDSADWVKDLATKLDRFASIINTKPIHIHGSHIKKRKKGTYAAAQRPASGWKPYTQMTSAQGQDFNIRLDVRWNTTPMYRMGQGSRDSQFCTMVHELSHLILDTEDYAYGEEKCQNLAPADAKRNADNWGYFVEEFR